MNIFQDVCELVSEVGNDFKEFKADISVDVKDLKDDCVSLCEDKMFAVTVPIGDYLEEMTNRISWSIDDLIEGIEKGSDFAKFFLLLPTIPVVSAWEMKIEKQRMKEREKVRKRKREFNLKYKALREEIEKEIVKNQTAIENKYIQNQINECYLLSKEFVDELLMINSFITETEKSLEKLTKEIGKLNNKKTLNKQAKNKLESLIKMKEQINEDWIEKCEYKLFLEDKIKQLELNINSLKPKYLV